MKWIFIAALMVFTPAAAAFLRNNQRYVVHACFLIGVAIFFQNPYFSVSPIFWDWPGPVQGLQVTLVDSLAIAILLSTPSVRLPPTLKLAFGIYLLGIFISSFAAHQLMPVRSMYGNSAGQRSCSPRLRGQPHVTRGPP